MAVTPTICSKDLDPEEGEVRQKERPLSPKRRPMVQGKKGDHHGAHDQRPREKASEHGQVAAGVLADEPRDLRLGFGYVHGHLPPLGGTTAMRAARRQTRPKSPVQPTTLQTGMPTKVSRLKGSPGMPVR